MERLRNETKAEKIVTTEKTILCAVLAGYAVFVDLQASVLRSSAHSIHDFQVLPMMIWGAAISITAIVLICVTFRDRLTEYRKKLRTKAKKKS